MFIVTTQVLENYGAHSEDGKYSSNNAYWKMKGGTDYLVEDLKRPQDAMAFVMAAFSSNNLGYKEFPIEVVPYVEWKADLRDLEEDHRSFVLENVYVVSPKTGKQVKRGIQ
jgi:hypothetical protein